jgi:SulP family sulfate permease
LAISLVFGAVGVATTVSFATLVFGENTEHYLNAGIAHFLLGGAIAGIILAVASSIRGQFGGIQDVSAALAGAVATSVAASLEGSSDAAVFTNVLFALVAAALLTAILFVIIGRFRLGNFVRFVPFPVVAGFLAATGWLLFKGGLEVAGGGGHLELLDLEYFLSHAHMDQVGWAIALGVVLYSLTRVLHGRLWVLPAMLVAAVAVFYGVVAFGGPTLDQLRADHWLIGPLPDVSFWETLTIPDGGLVDFAAVWSSLGSILTYGAVAVLALLVTASGLELEMKRDIDVNGELRRSGLANIFAGLTGSPTSWVIPPSTAVAAERGVLRPAFGLVHAGLLLVVFLAGPGLVSLFPRFVAGGLLVYLGVEVLAEWIWDTRADMPLADLSVSLVLVATVELAGLLAGVAVGLVASVIIFLVRYSSVKPIRDVIDGSGVQSGRDRPIPDERLLSYYDDKMLVVSLQGFIFFGSAHTVYSTVKEYYEGSEQPPMFLVVDMRLVQGVDSSAASAFVKMARLSAEHDSNLVIASGSPAVTSSLLQAGLDPDRYGHLRVFDRFDDALEWCEGALLESARGQLQKRGGGSADDEFLDAVFADVMDALEVQEEFEDLVQTLRPRMHELDVEVGETLVEQQQENRRLIFIMGGVVSLEKLDLHATSARVGTLGRWNMIGELGALLDYREPFTARVEKTGEVLVLPAEEIAAILRDEPEIARRLQRLSLRMLASKLEKTSQILAGS